MDPNDTSARPALDNATGPPPPPASSASGLSTGAQVGIGIGASVGGLVLVAAVWLLLRRHRRKSQRTRRVGEVQQLDSREKGGRPKELEAKDIYPELPGPGQEDIRHEMDSTERSTTVHELD